MAWDESIRPQTMDEMIAAWREGLALKATSDPAAWTRVATLLRTAAAALRDSYLPMAPQRAKLEALVVEMSTHLPERRVSRAPE